MTILLAGLGLATGACSSETSEPSASGDCSRSSPSPGFVYYQNSIGASQWIDSALLHCLPSSYVATVYCPNDDELLWNGEPFRANDIASLDPTDYAGLTCTGERPPPGLWPPPSSTADSPTSVDVSASVDSTGAPSLDEIDSEIAMATFNGAAADQPAPYFGAQNASGTASQPVAGFEPEAIHQEFCWAVDVINHRPQPRDEFEEIVVANHYFDAIEPYVVAELQDELALLIEFTASTVQNVSFTEANEVEDDSNVARAVETINLFVDRKCLGLSA